MTGVSFDSAVAQLVNLGWARETAEREVRRQLSRVGLEEPLSRAGRDAIVAACERTAAAVDHVDLPFSIVLPWSLLVSDNDRATPVVNFKKLVDGKPTATSILTERYKTARLNIASLVRQKLGGGYHTPSPKAPVARPVELVARVYVPDNRIHDVPDFAKGVHDALARQVYTNDAWIYRAVWERAGVDVDAPRAEITINPF